MSGCRFEPDSRQYLSVAFDQGNTAFILTYCSSFSAVPVQCGFPKKITGAVRCEGIPTSGVDRGLDKNTE